MTGLRVHVNTLSLGSQRRLMRELRSITNLDICLHAAQKALERGISRTAMIAAVQTGRLVEYRDNGNEGRTVLVRDQFGTCVVVNLNRESVVTAFTNDPKDEHRSLDTNKYLFCAGGQP